MNYEVNKVYIDDFGRKSGIFLIDKPVGKTSHDMVYKARKFFETKRVGHSGALDPFASGALIILAGKATKLSDSFLGMDKEYIAGILFGVSTVTGDPEGKISAISDQVSAISEKQINDVIKTFQPEYEQYAPVYSSVKINGDKLRNLARSHERFEIENGKVKFFQKEEVKKEIDLPKKIVKIKTAELIGFKEISKADLIKEIENAGTISKDLDTTQLTLDNYIIAECKFEVSKGTYIRQLAEDIGVKLGIPAMLLSLRRTKIGNMTIDNCFDLTEPVK